MSAHRGTDAGQQTSARRLARTIWGLLGQTRQDVGLPSWRMSNHIDRQRRRRQLVLVLSWQHEVATLVCANSLQAHDTWKCDLDGFADVHVRESLKVCVLCMHTVTRRVSVCLCVCLSIIGSSQS